MKGDRRKRKRGGLLSFFSNCHEALFKLRQRVTKRPLRLLMTADTVGGVWTYAIELATALGRFGVETVLATLGNLPSAEQRRQVAGIDSVELVESRFKLEWMQTPWADVRAAGEWLLDLEERVRPDLIHLNSYVHGALPWQAPTLVVGHSCVLSWWRAVHGKQAPSDYSRYRDLVGRGLRSAGAVAAPTRTMLGELERHYGPLPDQRFVIYNGRDRTLFYPRPKEHYLLAVGRLWDAAKNMQGAVAAARKTPWPIYLAGETHHPDGGQASVDHLHALGVLGTEALAGWYGRAPIYLFPARYEPFGLSVLEAGLSGCALVLGDIPSLRELWEGAALFVDPEDTDALADTLNALIDQPARRSELGRAARKRAEHYSRESMAAAYVDLYALLQSDARSGRVATVSD